MSNQQLIREELQEEALQAHLNNPLKRSTIVLSVGSGKTVIAITRIKQLYKQSRKVNILITGARETYLINFEKECKKFKCSEGLMKKITFSTVASLKKYKDIKYDLIIWDESHKDCKRFLEFSSYNINLNPNTEVICLTGTPLDGKRNFFAKNLYSKFPIVIKRLIEDSVESGLVNDYEITVVYHKLDQRNNIHVKTKKYDFYTNEEKSYKRLITKYSMRSGNDNFPKEMQYLKSFFKNLNSKEELIKYLINLHKGVKILVYAGSIAQANKLGYPTFNSKMKKDVKKKNLNNFMNGKEPILIDVNGIKESLSIDQLEVAIVSSVDASSPSFEQQLGRLLRLVPSKQTGKIYCIVAEGTIEQVWCEKALQNFDSNKIKFLRYS